MTRGVSVLLPVYNEARSIQSTVRSLLDQCLSDGVAFEVLAIDGGSTDGTRDQLDALAAGDARIRVVDNPARTTPHALNIGLAEAQMDFVAVLGAHSVYDTDYLDTCLKVVEADERVAGCSGRVVTVPGSSSIAGIVCHWVMTSRVGSSGRSFRTLPEGEADSIPYPVFRKSAITALGGYNERLTRNQDNDINTRLSAAGWKLISTWKTSCRYSSPKTLRFLLFYGFRNGRWNAVSLRENRRSMKLRHLLPACFVVSLVLAAVAGIVLTPLPTWARVGIAVSPLAAHLLVGGAEAAREWVRARQPKVLLGAPTALAFHVAYGSGTLAGLLRAPG